MKISTLFFLLSVFWVNLSAVETSPAAAPTPEVKPKSLEEIAAQRWTEMNTERITYYNTQRLTHPRAYVFGGGIYRHCTALN